MYATVFCLLVLFAGHVSAADSPPQQKPNFIVIITDDQGWDDMGLHNPKHVNTPNLDKFIRRSTFFDNFYVTPQCAQTRAALLTGRSYPRTGTVLVNGGYDFINRDEATAGQVMSEAGYQSLHLGKWHNKQTLGYEPWNVGFQPGQVPMATSGLISMNGSYEEVVQKDNEDSRMTQLLQYLGRRPAMAAAAAAAGVNGNATLDEKPFFVYYATNAIHVVLSRTESSKIMKTRVYPASYRDKYHNNPKYAGISHDTLDAWAMLEYLDVQLGRLFDFLETSGLRRSTYVMLLSDNGSALLPGEDRQLRMPSGMAGNKSTLLEGGVRTFLSVQGPGVQPSVIDSTLLDVTDVLPTMADLAGINSTEVNHKPWDGISFKNLLVPGSSSGGSSSNSSNSDGSGGNSGGSDSSGSSNKNSTGWRLRGSSLASKRQNNRFLVLLGPQCWDANAVPVLGNYSRQVLRPQPLLNYDVGGMRNSIHSKEMPLLPGSQRGFESCLAVRHKNFKWIGATNQVYRFANSSHLEVPSTEVPEPHASEMAALLSSAAKSWWESVVAEPNSFAKPTFYLGLGNWTATNVLAMGAHERTEGSITLMAMGATGFKNVGDRMCFKVKVLTAGQYDVIAMYTSAIQATVRLTVGLFTGIMARTAPSITTQLPPLAKLQGMSVGSFNLPVSNPNTTTEACLELVGSSAPGTSVFRNLANLRFIRRTDMGAYQDMPIEDVKVPRCSSSSSSSRSSDGTASSDLQTKVPEPAAEVPTTAPAGRTTTATPAAEPKVLGAATTDAAADSSRNSSPKQVNSIAHGFNRQATATRSSSTKAAAVKPAYLQSHRPSRPASLGVKHVVGSTQPGSRRMQPGRSAGPRQAAWLPSGQAESAKQHTVHFSSAGVSTARASSVELSSDWETLRQKYLLVDGQGVMESLFSPYETEGIDGCDECQPAL